MQKLIFKAGLISTGSLLATQLIRFAGNIVLAKLLAPSAFGVIGIVNMLLLGINLLSDVGLRQVVIQREGALSREFLNTVWVIQVLRGFGVWLVAIVASLFLLLAQSFSILGTNTYADPLLPFLIIGAASSAIFAGFESTNSITARRDLKLGRVTALALTSQLLAMGSMIVIARTTGSAWALVAGALVTAAIQSSMSHFIFAGDGNQFQFNKEIAAAVFRKSKWFLVSSPLTFFGGNAEVMILGALVTPNLLGNYMIAFLLANVIHQLANGLSANVFFAALSAAARDNNAALRDRYLRFQLASDAVIVTTAGGLMACGPTVVNVLFDTRYATAGQLLSYLALGLIGLRYHVIEQLISAQGNFRLLPVVTGVRLLFLIIGTFTGYHFGGLNGAAIGIGLSWFSGWPILLWARSKLGPFPWAIEGAAIIFLFAGYWLGVGAVAVARILGLVHSG